MPHCVLYGLFVGPVGPLLDVAQVRVGRAEARVEDSHPYARARVPEPPERLLNASLARACMAVHGLCVRACAELACIAYATDARGRRTHLRVELGCDLGRCLTPPLVTRVPWEEQTPRRALAGLEARVAAAVAVAAQAAATAAAAAAAAALGRKREVGPGPPTAEASTPPHAVRSGGVGAALKARIRRMGWLAERSGLGMSRRWLLLRMALQALARHRLGRAVPPLRRYQSHRAVPAERSQCPPAVRSR